MPRLPMPNWAVTDVKTEKRLEKEVEAFSNLPPELKKDISINSL